MPKSHTLLEAEQKLIIQEASDIIATNPISLDEIISYIQLAGELASSGMNIEDVKHIIQTNTPIIEPPN